MTMQPDHTSEDTEVLLVHGWKRRATFHGKALRAELEALEAALAPTKEGVFVVAQSLVYVDGEQDVVVGLPVASASADGGPERFTIESVRQIEGQTASAFSNDVRENLNPLLDEGISGEPSWFLVPTGALASGYCAHGALIDTPEDDEDGLITGCDMSQEQHEESVRGTKLAAAFDWDVEEVDLSEARVASLGEGQFFLIARYD